MSVIDAKSRFEARRVRDQSSIDLMEKLDGLESKLKRFFGDDIWHAAKCNSAARPGHPPGRAATINLEELG